MIKFKQVGERLPPFDGKWYLILTDDPYSPERHPAFVGRYVNARGRFVNDLGEFNGVTSENVIGYVDVPQTTEEFETHE